MALAVFGSVGAFKGHPALAASPIDLTLLAGFIVGVLVLAYGARARLDRRAGRHVLYLWTLLLPGMVIAVATGLPLAKSLYLFTFTLLACFAGTFVTGRARVTWLASQLALSVVMATLLTAAADPFVSPDTSRTVLAGGTTISSARVLGAGLVVSLVAVLTLRRRVALLAVGVSGLLLVSLLGVGSRGPFLSAMVAVAVTAVVLALRSGRAVRVVLAAALLTLASPLLLLRAGGSAQERTLSVLYGTNDAAREWLFRLAMAETWDSPLGLGWGGFSRVVEEHSGLTLAYPHNLPLELLVEGGWVFGGLAVLALLALIGRTARRTHDTAAVFVFAVLIYWFVNSLLSADVNGNREFWVAVGVALALRSALSRGRHETREQVRAQRFPAAMSVHRPSVDPEGHGARQARGRAGLADISDTASHCRP